MISKIKDSNSQVLATYEYDSRGNISSLWLGENETGKRVFDNTYYIETYVPEYAPDNPDKQIGIIKCGTDMSVKKYYCDNSEYRAKVIIKDSDTYSNNRRYYHDLQIGDTLTGTHSLKRYEFKLADGKLATTTDILPNGNRIKSFYKYYSTAEAYRVTKKTMEDPEGNSLIISESNYITQNVDGIVQCFVSQYIDAKGGTTNYTYSNGNLISRLDPLALAGGQRVTTWYEYDDEDRVILEYNSSPGLSTSYTFDNFSNMATMISNYGGTPEVTTLYEYNIYNEKTKEIRPEGGAKKWFYSSTGSLTEEYLYEGSNCLTAVSAKKYEFDSNGWLRYELVANEEGPWAVSGGDPAWVTTKYIYDAYGRKTGVIADYNGDDLTTQYDLNNQGEVTRVVNPDSLEKITIRDGRGLVVTTVNKLGTKSSTTEYFYDLNGNKTREVDPEGVTKIYQYDGFDRLIRTRTGK